MTITRNRRAHIKTVQGFTLMELMLVLGIIVLLMAAVYRIAPLVTNQGREAVARAGVVQLGNSVLIYQNKHSGSLPKSLDDLVGREIDEKMLIDPWGERIVYSKPARRSKTDKFDLFSPGKDGQPDTRDDIGNFETE